MNVFQIEHAEPCKLIMGRQWKGKCIIYMNDLKDENLSLRLKYSKDLDIGGGMLSN